MSNLKTLFCVVALTGSFAHTARALDYETVSFKGRIESTFQLSADKKSATPDDVWARGRGSAFGHFGGRNVSDGGIGNDHLSNLTQISDIGPDEIKIASGSAGETTVLKIEHANEGKNEKFTIIDSKKFLAAPAKELVQVYVNYASVGGFKLRSTLHLGATECEAKDGVVKCETPFAGRVFGY